MQAEQWVSKMSGSAENEAVEVEPEGRQSGSVWLLLIIAIFCIHAPSILGSIPDTFLTGLG